MFKVEIKTENDAFKPDPRLEIERILRDICARMMKDDHPLGRIHGGGCIDANGQWVGEWEMIEE